ncbi:MAG TPA: cobalamin-dependent protein, partial [Chitinivibrionales bacterium]|nr:cobalamin-dependent protein [Chitinivibrionales bacterium]
MIRSKFYARERWPRNVFFKPYATLIDDHHTMQPADHASPNSGARPRLLLINPFAEIKQFIANIGFAKLIGKRAGTTPLALPLLAALAPAHWDVRIIDEELEAITPGIAADLVGITALTTTIDRAYRIADSFRARGIKVVMGGPTVTCNPDEALTHADCVVVGEAEHVWNDLLDGAEHGTLKKVYQSAAPAGYKHSPVPRWDLIDTEKIAALSVQVSRGCPFCCDFCLVSQLFGRTMRYRDIDDIMAEIQSLPKKTLFFVDDNLTANKEFARALMKRLAPLGVLWIAQVSIEIADFPDLL